MAGGSNKHVDEPLERVLVYQGPQTKAMQFYVPLTVFAVECVALLVFFRFFQFWALLFVLPIHLTLPRFHVQQEVGNFKGTEKRNERRQTAQEAVHRGIQGRSCQACRLGRWA